MNTTCTYMYMCLQSNSAIPEYESDLRSNEDYLSSSKNKALRKTSGLYGINCFRLLFLQLLFISSVHNCKDHFHLHFLKTTVHIYDFMYSHSLVRYLCITFYRC